MNFNIFLFLEAYYVHLAKYIFLLWNLFVAFMIDLNLSVLRVVLQMCDIP